MLGLVAAAGLLASCDARTDGQRVAVRDSAGVRIVESSEPRLPPGSWSVASQPRLSIGVVDGPAEYQFTQIQAVRRLPHGGYMVAQLNNPPQVRLFDEQGGHVRSIGRAGQGPGELTGIVWADLPGQDTIRVYDFWASRITYFGLSGDVLEVIPIETLGGKAGRTVASSPGFSNGDFLVRSNYIVPRDATPGVRRSQTFLLRVAPTGELVDSFPTLRDADYVGTPERNIIIPLGRRSAALAVDSLLYVATGDAYEVEVYGPGGNLRHIFRRFGDRRPVSPEHVETLRDELLSQASDDNSRRRVEQTLADLPLPDRFPAYSRSMLGDAAGNLWVEHYLAPGDTARAWDVFDPEGQYVTAVTVPAEFELKQVIGEEAIGIWTDTLDVESVRIYTLIETRILMTGS
jgi:hypothetical protein